MTELDPFQHELDGLLLADDADTDGLSVISFDGLDALPDTVTEDTDNALDGQTAGVLRLAERAITYNLSVEDTSLTVKENLRKVMAPRSNRVTPLTLRWRLTEDEVTKRLSVRPANGRALDFGGDWAALVLKRPEPVIKLVASDPVIYSDALHSVSSWSIGNIKTVTNAGTFASDYPMPWQVTYTAASDTAGFYIAHEDFTDEFVQLWRTVTTGQVLAINALRQVTVDGVDVGGYVRGHDGGRLPNWPILRPGDNHLRINANSGSGTIAFTYRDTWV